MTVSPLTRDTASSEAERSYGDVGRTAVGSHRLRVVGGRCEPDLAAASRAVADLLVALGARRR